MSDKIDFQRKVKRGPSVKDWKAKWLAGLDVGDRFQTRRPVKLQLPYDLVQLSPVEWGYDLDVGVTDGITPTYYRGQVYYMREGLKRSQQVNPNPYAKEDGQPENVDMVEYAADGTVLVVGWQWQRDKLPAIFMPRRAARTFAKCVDVRVERFGKINYEDALAEGVEAHPIWQQKKENLHCLWTPSKHFNEVIIPKIYSDDPPKWWFSYTFEKMETNDE